MKFKGHDYKELIRYFEIENKINYDDLDIDNQEVTVLKDYIVRNYHPHCKKGNEDLIKPLTEYLKALIVEEEKSGYLTDVYKELLKLKDKSPHMYIQMYLRLLPCMWT